MYIYTIPKDQIKDGPKDDNSGWRTINGYCNRAKRLSYAIQMNRPIYSEARLSIFKNYSPQDHARIWGVISRYLRKVHLTALYIREANRTGTYIHYHFLVADKTPLEELANKFKASVPQELVGLTEVHVDRVRDQRHAANYFTKARVGGRKNGNNALINHHYTRDVYFKERQVFASTFFLVKHGPIGQFWLKPWEQYWQKDIVVKEKEIEVISRRQSIMNHARVIYRTTGEMSVYKWRKLLARREYHSLRAMHRIA